MYYMPNLNTSNKNQVAPAPDDGTDESTETLLKREKIKALQAKAKYHNENANPFCVEYQGKMGRCGANCTIFAGIACFVVLIMIIMAIAKAVS